MLATRPPKWLPQALFHAPQIMEGAVGSLTHAAPELLNSRCNTPQSDIYAFGVLMYEIISGKEPFKGFSVSDLIRLKTTTETSETLHLETGSDPIYTAFKEVLDPHVCDCTFEVHACLSVFAG
jgi:serine/threonine protein kinase